MNFTGSIVPTTGCQYEALGWGSFLQVIQNLLNFSVYIAVFFAVLIFAYAGFLLVTNPANSGNIDAAKKAIMSAIIGLVVVLGAWLIVNTVLSALGAGSLASLTGTLFTGNKCAETFYSVAPTNNGGGLTAGSGDCPGALICSSGKCVTDPEVDNGSGGAGDACRHDSSNCRSGLVCDNTNVCSTSATSADEIPASCSTSPEPDTGGGTGRNCPVPPASSMAALPASDVISGSGLATPTTVQNYIAMRAAAQQAGITLNVTSAYRSDQNQLDLWNQYCSSGVCGAKKVAKPCSLPGGTGSNHNSGQALDLTDGCHNGQSGCNTAAYNWLKTNGGKYGFYNAVPTDPVHWSADGH